MHIDEKRQRKIEASRKWNNAKKEKEQKLESDLAKVMMDNVDLKVKNIGLWKTKERLERELNSRSEPGCDYYGSGGLWGK